MGPLHLAGRCPYVPTVEGRIYAYLFGQYLGDGCISEVSPGVFRLRVVTCDDYPGIREECARAMQRLSPGHRVGRVQRVGCAELWCSWEHWLCLFPQHGPGRKHLRELVLAHWQDRIVLVEHPEALVRGLIHSDGCRVMNKITWQTASGDRTRAYPRYFFKNESADIRRFFIAACERVGIHWTQSSRNTISVAARASVARLDEIVGPKR